MKEKGVSTLILVFIITTLLAMVIFVVYPISFLSAKRANQILSSQQTFFAAEGAMYETIQHLKNDPNWPDLSLCPPDCEYQDDYFIGDPESQSKIKRSLKKMDDGSLEIDISAETRKTKRRLVGSYRTEEISGEEPIPAEGIGCEGLTVDVDFEDLEHFERGHESFSVAPGESWVTKGRIGGSNEYVTFCNNTPDTTWDIPNDEPNIFETNPNDYRRWLCHGTCPHFNKFYENFSSDEIYNYGDDVAVVLGDVAILDDDPDDRINCFVLIDESTELDLSGPAEDLCESAEEQGGRILHTCNSDQDDEWLSPPCQYLLQPGDSGRIVVIHEDSTGVDRLPAIITGAGETFWLHEEIPEPEE